VTRLSYPEDIYRYGQVRDVEQDGRFAVGNVSMIDSGYLNAGLWNGGDLSFSLLPRFDNQVETGVFATSHAGRLLGGAATPSLDGDPIRVKEAVYWRDRDGIITNTQSGKDYEQRRLIGADGKSTIDGSIATITDSGYAAGQWEDIAGPDTIRAFIYHVDWPTPRLIDEWLLNEFGVTLPCDISLGDSSPRRVDMHDDGERLWIAGGSCVVGVPHSTINGDGPGSETSEGDSIDCNGDGDVTQADLLCATENSISQILNAGQIVPGDIDLDGQVTFGDFLVLSTNFGNDDLVEPTRTAILILMESSASGTFS